MGDDEGTRARGVGGRCRSILRAASDALTRCETRLNEVNEKYTFELCPEYRLKVNKTIGTTRVGMTFDARERRYRVAVKRAGSMKGEDESEREDDVPLFWRAMNKLVLDPEEKRIELYSRRVDYGPLSLRGVGEYNATDGEWGLRWQLQTFQKEKKRLRSAEYELNDRVRGCLRWDVQSVAPEVEGAVGSKEKFSFDVDVGSSSIVAAFQDHAMPLLGSFELDVAAPRQHQNDRPARRRQVVGHVVVVPYDERTPVEVVVPVPRIGKNKSHELRVVGGVVVAPERFPRDDLLRALASYVTISGQC